MKVKTKINSFLLFIFTLSLTVILSCSSFSQNVKAVGTNTSDIDLIAKNTPQYLMPESKKYWKNTIIIDKIPLYDFNNKLIAYNFDLSNNSNNQKAYVIISVSEDDGPILEFGTGHYSPYYKMNTNKKTLIYGGVLNYYSNDQGNYYDIKMNTKISSAKVSAFLNNSKHKQYVSDNINKSKIERYNIENVDQSNEMHSNICTYAILNVPDYEWYKGCAPTSAGMVVKYNFSSALSNVGADTIIGQLASAMATDSSGSTVTDYIPGGIETTMAKYNFSTECWNEGVGKSSSTFSKYKSEIDSTRSIIVNLYNSTETAPSYPDGFGSHSMAGCGYKITSGAHYLIVRDTGCDGGVYCNYDSSALGTPCWTYVHAD